MSRKLFQIVSILVLLSMLVVPVSAKPAAQPAGPDGKLQLEAVDASQVARVGNPNAVVKGEEKGASGEANYIVQLVAPPLASYRGGVPGLEATSPRVTGATKLDVNSAASQAYLAYLANQQAQALSAIDAALGRQVTPLFQYQYAFNGFALKLSPAEAAKVAKLPGVLNVWREKVVPADTDAGPTWIGAPGIWDGTATGGLPGTKGEGVIAGILDTGINHDHPSFADVGDDGYNHTNPFGSGNYVGWCDTDDPTFCNDKLIGAWDFVYALTPPPPNFDYPSPEDENEHGSHTASTVAGNVVTATLIAPTLSYTKTISGVAPHANIIAYDVCYTLTTTNQGLCPNTSSMMAADQALLDGVDLINFSIGGGADPYNDPVELAFLSLFEAGVFVSTSAGNEGPGPNTLGHQSPWVSTTAAATHNRAFPNYLVDMAGGDTMPPADFQGLGFTTGYGPADIVYAGDYGDPLCPLGAFPPGTFSGEIVVCDRGGGIARVDKAQSVADGGAGGFVLANNAASGTSLNGDAYAIPGVHITYADGVTLKTWLATGAGHTATITGIIESTDPANGDILAAFSSRGPNTALDIIKPSTTAPGVDIWAAVNTPDPDNPGPPEYNFLSGTSMASPHNAGAAALLRALHPDWSVAEIMSALMSTADTTVLKEDGVTDAGYYDMGSGRVNLLGAGIAGFVLDETAANMQAADPAAGGDPRTLNLASMADSQCLESCTWTRTISSTLDYDVDWTVTASSPDGVVITVTPDNFSLSAGGSQELTITATVGGLPTGDWLFGQVNFEEVPVEGVTQVAAAHFPLAVIPAAGIFPASVDITTRRDAGSQLETGLQAVEITDLTVENFGLTQATLTSQELSQDPTNGDPYDNLNDGTTFFITTTVPADAKRLVAEITYSEAPDLDLFVGLGDTPSEASLVCASNTGIALESCDIADPAEGMYWILVQNWQESGDPPDLVTLASAVVPGTDSGNMMVEGPTSVPTGTPFDIRVYWDTPEMVAGDRWYGAFSLGSDPGNPGNIATIPVNIIRANDDVAKEASAEMVMPGDTVTYTITVQPNVFSQDLNYTITDTIPAGLTYVPGSATASDGTVSVDGDTVTWTGLLAIPGYTYNIDTSLANPACSMPLATDGAYVDLEAYGILANPAIFGDTIWFTSNPSGGEFDFFGSYQGELINFTDDGFAFFDPSTPGTEPYLNYSIPTPGDPDNLMAIFWRDLEVVYDASTNRGVSLANLTSGGQPNGFLIEYDDVEDWPAGSNPTYDFEVLARYEPSDDYEYVFAYDNLTGNVITGTIGLENVDGTVGAQYGFDDLDIVDEMAVCFDLVQSGVAPVTITYAATVDAEVTPGLELTNNAVHNTDNPGSMEAVASDTVFVESAYLEVGHLAPFAADPGTAVTVTLNGAPALTGFEYGDSTGYIPLLPGDYDVAVFPQGSADPAITGTVTLMDGIYYTAIAIGDGVNQPLALRALVDDLTPPAAGKFHLRLGHLAPFASGAALADIRLQDGTPVITDVAFSDVTAFIPLDAGEYDLKITTPGGATTLIDPVPVTFSAGDIVSVFATGDGTNQPLGAFAWPAGVPGDFLPLATYLEVGHLAPFAADPGTAVTVTLNDEPVLTGFAYGDSTGYLTLPEGTYDVAVWPAGSTAPAISGTVTLMTGIYYTAIAIGDGVNQPLALRALVDDLTPPAAGKFHLRLGHLAPFASGDALADIRLQNGTLITTVAYSDVTAFIPLDAGEYDLKITTPGGGTTLIDPLPVTFNAGDIVSAYATGDGSNQPLGVFAWPAGVEGFFLPLAASGVELAPAAAAQSGAPGETVEYTLTVTNTGDLTDTFSITATAVWDVQLPVTGFTLGPGESAPLTVNVNIPAGAANGDSDLATVTVMSETDPSSMAESELTTTAVISERKVFLPLVMDGFNAP